MRNVRIVRLVATASATVAMAALAATAGAQAGIQAGTQAGTQAGVPAKATGTSDLRPAAATTYPTNAGKIFRWGNAQWNDEFVTPLKSMWNVTSRAQVRDQHGMLTLDATATSGTVSATLKAHDRQYGRWEARVRSRQYGAGAGRYELLWELVPNDGDTCGTRSIILSDYVMATRRVTMHLRNKPNADFTAVKLMPLNNVFHTYAVEVTPDHISWFVDTHVIMTERRPAARTGATYTVKFALVAPTGVKMNPARMQMDWVRYYTLARPDAKPITAPQATLTTYAGAC